MFLSRTSELTRYPEERPFATAARSAVSAAGYAVVEMPGFTAESRPTAQVCRDKVRDADIYVLIAGYQYGSPVLDQPQVSYTELEFETAKEAGLPRLVFLLNKDAKLPRDVVVDQEYGDRQEKFRRRLSDGAELTRAMFKTPDELEKLLYMALRQLPSLADGASPEHGDQPTLPVVASAAQRQLRSVLDLLQRAALAMEQVGYSYAEPPGMDGWSDWDYKKRKHKQLADLAADPAAELKSCLEEASGEAEKARKDVRRLGAKRFAKRSASLTATIKLISDLQDMSGRLIEAVERAQDELEERADDYPDYYRSLCETLSQAYDSVEQVSRDAILMKQALDRLRAVPEAESTPAARSQERQPHPGAVSSGRTAASVSDIENISVEGKVAAGSSIMSDGEEPDTVPVPSDFIRGSGTFALKVYGDSMLGDGLRDGDYVIVDINQEWKNGDMVVVLTAGPGGPQDPEATVKRLWRDEKVLILQSSNPAYKPMTIGADVDPGVAGKVIGIFRSISG